MSIARTSVIALLGFAAGFAREPGFEEYRAVQESLRLVHPRFRASWLKEREIQDDYWQGCVVPVDSGLRCVGRWSFGPSYDVDGRATPTETLVALARGSGVSLIRFARTDSIELELLSDVNAGGLMKRVAVRDSLLYVGSTAGLEIWSIADEHNARRLSWLHTALNDFDVQDSLAYVIGPDDSFKVYNVSNAANPVFRGACRDSGDVVSVAGNTAFVGDRWGLYVLDVSSPSLPRRSNSWGSAIEGVAARGHICYVSQFNPNQPGWLRLNVLRSPAPDTISLVGFLDAAGGFDVHVVDSLAFCSGDQYGENDARIVSVADSANPRFVAACSTGGGGWGIWASGASAAVFVGDYDDGLKVFDVSLTAAPELDTTAFDCGFTEDIQVEGERAYLAVRLSGLKVLDLADPTRPRILGELGTTSQSSAVATADSFAYVGWWFRPTFRVVSVVDPRHPVQAGSLDLFGIPEAMVVRDSFVYCAMDRRLQIVNAARPSQPALTGSCTLAGSQAWNLRLCDTLAYVAASMFTIANVARPSSPQVLSQGSYAMGVEVVDTIAYVGSPYWFKSLSVADPRSPYILDSVYVNDYVEDVAVIDTLAYAAATLVHVFNIADPGNLRELTNSSVPGYVRRLCYSPPYVYAACTDAGVAVYETAMAAITDRQPRPPLRMSVTLRPSVTTARVSVLTNGLKGPMRMAVHDVAGVEVRGNVRILGRDGAASLTDLDLSGLPAGVYAIVVAGGSESHTARIVKAARK